MDGFLVLKPLMNNLTALCEETALHDFVFQVDFEFLGFLVVESCVGKEGCDVS